MKSLLKTLLAASVVVLATGSCSNVPGTDQWKIRKAATAYIERGLADGQSMRWEHIERKCYREVDGKGCKYAKVRYTLVTDEGEEQKTLYLLMSEHCDSLYAVSDKSIVMNPQFGMTDEEAERKVMEVVDAAFGGRE